MRDVLLEYTPANVQTSDEAEKPKKKHFESMSGNRK